MIRKSWIGNHLIFVLALCATVQAIDPRIPLVEPADLTRRPDLLGRPVAVDDRVSRFQWRPATGYYDEVYLKRTSVCFRLPLRLRYEHGPKAAAVRIEGVLKREGDQWFCDVSAIDLLPSDLERLERDVAALSPVDAEKRVAWARWAESRGKAFEDEALLDRARLLEGEAIRIEAERRTSDPPRLWLELARRGRERQVPEPEPSALAHRAFAARLATTEGVADLQALVKEIEDFWPKSPTATGSEADLDAWLVPYANDPAAAYRAAPGPVREALDHRLWADATHRLFERRIAAEPGRALELAQEVADALKDRPKVVERLLEEGLERATRDLGSLRRGDVEGLARIYRETLHRPEPARELLRRWLDDQRLHRLSAADAEGRVILADQYESLIDDRDTAVALLRDAWRIDPQSKETADAFRRRGFRKVNDQWIESPRAQTDLAAETDLDPGTGVNARSGPSSPFSSSALRGLTPQEVRSRLGGKPDRVVWSASQGQLIEQWIYRGTRQDQYLNFLHTPGEPLPKVVAYYARPRYRAEPPRNR